MSQNIIQSSIIQQQCYADVDQNKNHITKNIEQATNSGSQLIVLSELHSQLYFCQQKKVQNFELAESIHGITSEWLSNLAKKNRIIIVGSLFEKTLDERFYNTALVFDVDGSLAGIYRKMHIPEGNSYFEKYYFSPGDLGFTPIKTSLLTLGIQICWDQWFPEGARLLKLAGADVLIYPSAIGWENNDSLAEKKRQLDAWITIQRSHAIANSLPLICANRQGLETSESSSINFWGNSFICDSFGKVLQQAGSSNNEIVTAKIDIDERNQIQEIWPFINDRRTDAYENLSSTNVNLKCDSG